MGDCCSSAKKKVNRHQEEDEEDDDDLAPSSEKNGQSQEVDDSCSKANVDSSAAQPESPSENISESNVNENSKCASPLPQPDHSVPVPYSEQEQSHAPVMAVLPAASPNQNARSVQLPPLISSKSQSSALQLPPSFPRPPLPSAMAQSEKSQNASLTKSRSSHFLPLSTPMNNSDDSSQNVDCPVSNARTLSSTVLQNCPPKSGSLAVPATLPKLPSSDSTKVRELPLPKAKSFIDRHRTDWKSASR